ncbi:MAG: toxic anion resistance protein [Lachnospiraceae bacterium]|nr:toxic anion resistance protein [Lachnospiraceae bacterium]
MATVYQYHENQKELVRAFEELDFEDSNIIMQLGHHAQVNISTLSESVLSGTKNLRTQDIITTLEHTIDELSKFQKKDTTGRWRLTFSRKRANDRAFLNWCRNVEGRMDMVSERLREHQVYLMKNIVMLEEFARMNRMSEAELEEAISIGHTAIVHMEEEKQAVLESNIEIPQDDLEVFFAERNHQRERIELRIQELQLSRQVSHQLNEQFSILKYNQQTMADKIQGVLWNTMVLWKNQVALMMEQGQNSDQDHAAIDRRNKELIDRFSEMVQLKKEDDEMLDHMKQTTLQ